MSTYIKLLAPIAGPNESAGNVGDVLPVPEAVPTATANALIAGGFAVSVPAPAATVAAKFSQALATLSPATSPAVDGTGGTPSPTAAAITAGAAYAQADAVAMKNAISFLYQQVAALQTLLINSSIVAKQG